MMSLTEANLPGIIKKQYIFKLLSYSNVFVSLVALQLFAILFTLGGMVGIMSSGSMTMGVLVKFYSGAGILVFTFIWALSTAYILSIPSYRNIDFAFVSNRLSSNLANIVFLLTTSIAGGVTAMLSSIMLRNIVYYTGGSENVLGANFFISPRELLTGAAAAVLYLLLLSAVGYFLGMLIQLNKTLIIILPALIVGTLILETRNEHVRIILRAIDFFAHESSLAIFFLKVTLSVLLLWGCTILFTNKMDVRT